MSIERARLWLCVLQMLEIALAAELEGHLVVKILEPLEDRHQPTPRSSKASSWTVAGKSSWTVPISSNSPEYSITVHKTMTAPFLWWKSLKITCLWSRSTLGTHANFTLSINHGYKSKKMMRERRKGESKRREGNYRDSSKRRSSLLGRTRNKHRYNRENNTSRWLRYSWVLRLLKLMKFKLLLVPRRLRMSLVNQKKKMSSKIQYSKTFS